jgi:hypothetical protein
MELDPYNGALVSSSSTGACARNSSSSLCANAAFLPSRVESTIAMMDSTKDVKRTQNVVKNPFLKRGPSVCKKTIAGSHALKLPGQPWHTLYSRKDMPIEQR